MMMNIKYKIGFGLLLCAFLTWYFAFYAGSPERRFSLLKKNVRHTLTIIIDDDYTLEEALSAFAPIDYQEFCDNNYLDPTLVDSLILFPPLSWEEKEPEYYEAYIEGLNFLFSQPNINKHDVIDQYIGKLERNRSYWDKRLEERSQRLWPEE